MAIPFTHVVVDADAPLDPHCKAVGDVTGNGRLDLFVASAKGGGVFWYEAPSDSEAPSGGAGPTWAKHRIDEGSFTTNMAAGDIDGDGHLDVVVPAGGEEHSPLYWYRNPLAAGRSPAGPWEKHVIGTPKGHHDVVLADLVGDGRLEVIVRGQSSFSAKSGDEITFYRRPADGRWEMKTIACPHGEGIAAADLNGNGRLDLVINSRWYENPGDIFSPWPEHVFAPEYTHPDVKVAAADLNGDGRPEIVMVPSELAGQVYRISWFEAGEDPTAAWAEHVIAEEVECVLHSLALADMDGSSAGSPPSGSAVGSPPVGSGEVDIVTAMMHQGQPPQEVYILHNRGGGESWEKQVVATSGSHNIVVADITGDGLPDIFGCNWNTNAPNRAAIEYWRNDLKRSR